jgi:two-component system response regulator NreC
LLCSVTDTNLLKGYDESIALYDDIEVLNKKLVDLMNLGVDETDGEQEALSQREKEIICCVVRGMTNKETAEKLFLSIHTVITHRRNIARKLQIHSPAGLTIYAIVNKLVELSEVKMNL